MSSEKLIGPLGPVADAEADKGRHPELAVGTRVKSRLDEPGCRILLDCLVGPWELQRLTLMR